jgi:membrane-associated PAP2 superfamily phosphatase
MPSNKQIFLTVLILLASIVFFAKSDIDIYVQDMFFNFDTNKYILDSHLQPYRFIFYDGIKKLLIVFAVVLLFSLIFFRRNRLVKEYKKGIIIVVLSAVFIPVSVGALKKETNMPCPKNEIRYGGNYPKTAVWESYEEDFKYKDQKIKCWPAGHASGGFALLSLFFLFKSKRNKTLALGFALSVGWSMGVYKMLIGDHFLSHTVITMLLAWLIVLIIAKSVYRFSKL